MRRFQLVAQTAFHLAHADRGPLQREEAMHVDSNWLTRSVRLGVVLTAALGVMQGTVRAQDYPSQDIRFICGFPAGSGADVLVRYFGEKVRPFANRTIIVENKVGAAGNIAAVYTARSKPDGHTVYVHAASAIAANRRQQAAVHGDGPGG
jgi:tripartite-type tricarboxylate transporter receptor subunit TctC